MRRNAERELQLRIAVDQDLRTAYDALEKLINMGMPFDGYLGNAGEAYAAIEEFLAGENTDRIELLREKFGETSSSD